MVYEDESGFEQELRRRAGARAELWAAEAARGTVAVRAAEAVSDSGSAPVLVPVPGAAAAVASRRARLGAAVVDAVAGTVAQTLLLFATFATIELVADFRGLKIPEGVEDQLEEVFLWAYALALHLANHFVLQAATGGSLGKLALGLRVARAKDRGGLGWGRALGRYFARWLSFVSLGMGLLPILWNRERLS